MPKKCTRWHVTILALLAATDGPRRVVFREDFEGPDPKGMKYWASPSGGWEVNFTGVTDERGRGGNGRSSWA